MSGPVGKRFITECDCKYRHDRNLVGILGVLGPAAISVLTFLDRLTPAFAGLLNFRIRIIAASFFTLILFLLALIIAFRKHVNKANPVPLHYSFGKKARLGAKIVIIPLLISFFMSAYSLRFLSGQSGSLQGQVLGASDAPLYGVKVDVVNLDKESVCERIEETDTKGRYVVDIVNSKGRPAYWSLTCPSDSLPKLENFPDTLIGVLTTARGANERSLNSGQVPPLHLICPVK